MVASAGAILRASGLRRWGSLPRTPKLWAGARGSATVSLEPAGRCAWDEPVRISVRGLGPGQPVTLRASLRDERGALFRAHARYRADDRGLLDLARAPALGGSFVGLEPMGLLWALEPETPLVRLVKRDVQTPFAVELEVLDGHEPDAGRLLGRALHERHFLRPGVRRVPVRVGRVRGTLFLPPEPGPFPGIVDIYGVGSGLLEYRASLLAGKGFAVMALAYHNYEDLPKGLEILHLEYFEEAVNYLLDHPQVKGPGVGLLGTSKGDCPSSRRGWSSRNSACPHTLQSYQSGWRETRVAFQRRAEHHAQISGGPAHPAWPGTTTCGVSLRRVPRTRPTRLRRPDASGRGPASRRSCARGRLTPAGPRGALRRRDWTALGRERQLPSPRSRRRGAQPGWRRTWTFPGNH
ncbi:acyl-coenzyme A thioesterase 2, mitochondrial-like isoform X3 [Vulpes lagopus]|uniref:acyl-coenzyme A thioesterase 2, mitochondrial-like isoform X3 n=1 Tax=Vulpes lagopus TaxID=494514 RepID=UPI001BC988D4|nr:acyl-coenzyme A thioesterase 2, mitochondrial-like isoform X3 [Vulpes lagopus]